MAAGRFLSNRFPGLGAALVVPIVIVAASTAGPPCQNLGPLGMVSGVIGFETTGDIPDVDGSTG